MPRLAELAKEISSKNAGAFAITFDIVFDDRETYMRVKRSGIISAERIAEAYGMPLEEILHVVEFDQGNAFKVAVRRSRPSGAIGETDVFGAQQYAPLLDFEVP
jgi:uncharacterized protein DUF4387